MRLPCSSAFRNFFRKLRHFIQIYHGNNFLIRACIINRTRLTISSNIRSFKEQVNFQQLCNHQDESKTAVYIHIYVYIHSPALNKMSLRHLVHVGTPMYGYGWLVPIAGILESKECSRFH